MTLLDIWTNVLPKIDPLIEGMTDPCERFWGRSSYTFFRTMLLETSLPLKLRVCSIRAEWVVLFMRKGSWVVGCRGELTELEAIPTALRLVHEVNRR